MKRKEYLIRFIGLLNWITKIILSAKVQFVIKKVLRHPMRTGLSGHDGLWEYFCCPDYHFATFFGSSSIHLKILSKLYLVTL